jgi:DNA-binding transcriptional MocR family regulator
MATLVRYGDRVIVENPTFPPFMDLLEHYGLDAVPVGLDDEGMIPAEFASALATAPALILLQPRAHNPTGISMSHDRAEHLATLLRRSRVATKTIVIEDDHSWAIAMSGEVSLGRFIPERVLHVRSFSKSHGPDLRIGALGGPRELIDRVVARRLLGPGWTSRMLQGVVFELLTAVESLAQVDTARRTYGQRQVDFATALGRYGVALTPRDGINMWWPVADERAATVSLAASGIRVAPGTPFRVGSGDASDTQAHVRVTVGMLRDDPETIAGAIATATRL